MVYNSKKYNNVLITLFICGILCYIILNFQSKFLIENKPETTELVLTGRNAPNELIELADLVTEMKEVKHYFQKGVMARKGIEK